MSFRRKGKVMVYIEFFTENSLENICSSLIEPPETLYLLGSRKGRMNIHAQRYCKLFESRGYHVDVRVRFVNNGDKIFDIVEALKAIIDETGEGECAIDLTGGDELCLTAAGIVYGEYLSNPKEVQLHQVRIHNCRIINCDKDERTLAPRHVPDLAVDEFIALYGGRVKEREIGFRMADLDDKKRATVHALWKRFQKSRTKWLALTDVLNHYIQNGTSARIDDSDLRQFFSGRTRTPFNSLDDFRHYLSMSELSQALSMNYSTEKTEIAFRDDFSKKCLSKEGNLLELYTLVRMCELKDGGNPLFQDGVQSVTIQTFSSAGGAQPAGEAVNETDVIMMRHMSPYFISCKTGTVDSEELNRFYASVDRYGGRYATKILIYNPNRVSGGQSFMTRAEVLGIRLIEMNDLDKQNLVDRIK